MAIEIPEAIHESLTKEFRIAADKMKEVADLPSKLFFFSAMFAAVHRALNVTWSNELALLHDMLQTTHANISGRLSQMAARQQRPIQIPEEVPDRITEVADKLADILVGENIDETVLFGILADLAALSYSTTGNGYYLYLKGDLKL